MDLASKEISKEAGLKIKFEGGNLILGVAYDGKGLDGEVNVKIEASYFLDLLAEAIPGQLDDSIIAAVKLALK